MRTVVFSFLGTQLDAGKAANRWERWRPTVALCQHEDLLIDGMELIYPARSASLAQLVCEDIARISPETGISHHIMNLANPWDLEEVYGAMMDLVRDYDFDIENTRYLANLTTGTHVAQICWFLLTEARYLPGQLIQLSPPRKLADGTLGSYQFIDLDLSRYDQIARRFALEHEQGASFLKSGIVTRNATFNAMIDEIENVVIRSQAPVLLLGPTGAGKSQLARRIYELKRARHQIEGAFVEVNCATLRGDNAMSTLFGHKRGAFTGAVVDRGGMLRAADHGLLFLDEVGELGLDEQAMILGAIEDKRFFPVGSDSEVSSNFQLIAGTNRDLRGAVHEGRFRANLLARLNLWTFELPSLKSRVEDIPANLQFELERYARETGRQASFNKEAERRYLDFATAPQALWSGNFRDLSASVTRMATLAEGGRIDRAVVEHEIERLTHAWSSGAKSDEASRDPENLIQAVMPDDVELDLFDRAQLEAVLRVCRRSASLSAAGRELFAVSRRMKRSSNDADRLKKYLARFGLSWNDVAGRG